MKPSGSCCEIDCILGCFETLHLSFCCSVYTTSSTTLTPRSLSADRARPLLLLLLLLWCTLEAEAGPRMASRLRAFQRLALLGAPAPAASAATGVELPVGGGVLRKAADLVDRTERDADAPVRAIAETGTAAVAVPAAEAAMGLKYQEVWCDLVWWMVCGWWWWW